MEEKLDSIWGKHALNYGSSKAVLGDDILEKERDPIVSWLEEAKRAKKKGAKVLDLGCGIGQYVKIANILGFKGEGIDISKEAVRIARKNKLKVILGDMRSLPYKKDSFDIVIAGGSIEHFEETDESLREIYRVLKKDGIFIGNVPYRYTVFVATKKIQQALGLWKLGYEKSFTMNNFKNILKRNGLKMIQTKRHRIAIGKHRVLSSALRTIDEPLFKLGWGGAHFYFKAIKK